MFALKRLLEEHGHRVVVFSMHHPKNFESEYSGYFVSYINYDEEVRNINLFSGLKVMTRAIYSREARRKIEQLIKDEKPEIAHINNIHHHITPSIFYPLRKYRIPIVWTLHDYTVICPNTSFLAHGKICERCRKRKYFWPAVIKCKKGSFLASLMAGFETTIHRLMRVNDLVDLFVAPSMFLREKLVEYGFSERKIICLYHFNEIPLVDENGSEDNYILYIGRLTEEKGIKTLVESVASLDIEIKLKIIGDGPLMKDVQAYVKSKEINTIEFLGHRQHEEVLKYIRKSSFVVLPSEWYENYPFAVIEAFACGKAVIGSDTGGIPELVRDTERGLLFEMGNSIDLKATINFLLKNPDIVMEMGEDARRFVNETLNSKKYYKTLLDIYTELLLERK
jgi:glycosyltransferase involved in cell wall biosynthesis